MGEKTPRFIMRVATEKDTDALIALYRTNQHQSVYTRREEIYRQRVKDKAVIIVTDEGGTILGATIAHPSPYNDFNNTEFIEFGSTRMVGVPKGFPFYEHMLAAQVVHQFLFFPPHDRVIADVHLDNPKVIERLTKNVGFAPYTPSKDLLDAKKSMIDPEELKKSDEPVKPAAWFQCGVEAVPQNARLLLDRYIDSELTNSRDPSIKIELDVSQLPCFKVASYMVFKLAQDNFGNPEKPSPQRKWQAVSQRWIATFRKRGPGPAPRF